MLNFHPDAVKTFDDTAETLLTKLTTQPNQRGHVREGFVPDLHVAAVIPESDIIGELVATPNIVDQDGDEVGRYFEVGDQFLGLVGESYQNLITLVENIWRIPSAQSQVSRAFLINTIFEWMQSKQKDQNQLTMTEHLIAACRERIRDQELWFPIAWLHIESEIELGRVVFRTITREMLNVWHARVPSFDEETNLRIRQAFERERHSLLGFAAATIDVHAEPERAYEIAVEEAKQAVDLLRFFSPANFSPNKISYCTLLGREHLEGSHYLNVKDGQIMEYTLGTIDQSEPSWRLDNRTISEISRGLNAISDLLLAEKKTEFNNAVLESLLMYSRNSLAKTYSDKLTYILVALESLLLKDSGEPIQKSLAERMAVLVSNTLDTRLSIIRNFSETYALRSRFIHHGQTISKDNLITLKAFMNNAWRCLHTVAVGNASRFSTKANFLDAVERLRLSGGTTG